MESKKSLVDFSSVEKNLRKFHLKPSGIHAIEIDKIVGSLGRYNDFHKNLIPKRSTRNTRYETIKKGMLGGMEMPPIKVYQVLDNYFVIDGHHRVNIAKNEFNAKYIDAEVIEVHFEMDLNLNKTYTYSTEQTREFLLKLEEDAFEKKTFLVNKILKYPVKVTELSSYAKLYEEIENFYEEFEKETFIKRAFIYASYKWYETRFLPAVNLMETENLLNYFPRRTHADLYVWIQQHKYYLSQKHGRDVGFDYTVHDFLKKYNRRKVFALIYNFIDDVIDIVKKKD
ncbi:MAG: DUF4032 domain-containing protein [Elusimicrobia bacterium]|nr:DUF4032 domain-containing protein [Elusimicrobiota bacterium]